MVASDHDRRLDLARPYELIDREPRLRAIAETQPADPCRQALECNSVRGQLEPALENAVLRKEPPQHVVDRRDVRRVTRQHRPAERPDPSTEERSNIGRDEARVCEG